MRIVCISDTHTYHRKVDVPEGDVLVHAGDFTFHGELDVVDDFNKWLGEQKSAKGFKSILVIAGNHDLTFDAANHLYDPTAHTLITNAIYLNDSGVEIDGVNFWGSPIQPWFHDWAFNRGRGQEIKAHWDLIPSSTNVLITHGPPAYVLDKPFGRQHSVGCVDLRDAVNDVKPALHVFGHIHGGYGQEKVGGTHFLNASVVNEDYRVVNPPHVVDL